MLSVSSRPRRRNSGRPQEKSARGFLQWLRGRDCVFEGAGDCRGKVQAMHLDFAGDKGIGTKVSDRYSLPGCEGHHGLQHRIGWPELVAATATSKGELLRAAERYWNAWPGRIAWERKLEAEQ